jgi:sterol desaturase/sphingolipid hydroxylase (fatty acid hydroxylase superfamily)
MYDVARVLFGLCVAATAAEGAVALRGRRRIYRTDELRADLGVALLGFGVLALHRGVFLALYAAVYSRCALWKPATGGSAAWLLTFVVYDFIYYVDHRSTHTFRLLWASHRIHHQTRAFHLLTGLRMSAVGPILGYPFRLPLAVLGVHPLLYVSVDVVHALCTYLLHARFVPDLGRIDWVLNTPAHHRLHHSASEAHFGKNYGGVLLVWDRVLGTYSPAVPVEAFGEQESMVPLGPIRAHVEPIRRFLDNRSGAGAAVSAK